MCEKSDTLTGNNTRKQNGRGTYVFDERQVTSKTNRSNPKEGDPAPTMHDPSRFLLTSSSGDSRARTSQLPDAERGFRLSDQDSSLSLSELLESYGPDGYWSRTFPDFSHRREVPTSRGSGTSLPNAGMDWRGESWTANISESPSGGVGSTLSDILEARVPRKYFLSPKAAAGILRRAERRGKALPPRLEQALTMLAGRDTTTKAMLSEQSTEPLGITGSPTPHSQQPQGITSPRPLKLRTDTTDEAAQEETEPTTSLATFSESEDGIREQEILLTTPQLWLFDPPKQEATAGESFKTERPILLTEQGETLSVRRLTPTECERLQGMPDGWTVPDTPPVGTP